MSDEQANDRGEGQLAEPEPGSLSPTANAPSKSASGKPSWLPSWAPWAVLGFVVTFGLLGGLGVIPVHAIKLSHAAPAASHSASLHTAGSKTGPLEVVPGGSAAPGTPRGAVTVMHIVVAHNESPLGKSIKTARSKGEALKRAREARSRALTGESFDALVNEYSDEPASPNRKKGLLGPFRYADAVKPFNDVAFALKPGAISAVTQTTFGYHVIQRTK